jgi:hypothetical protein
VTGTVTGISSFLLECDGRDGRDGHFPTLFMNSGPADFRPPDERYIWLKGDLVLPVEPVRLVLELEARDFRLSRDGDAIWVRPFSKLTDQDKAQLKLWKPHVLALLDYQAPALEV